MYFVVLLFPLSFSGLFIILEFHARTNVNALICLSYTTISEDNENKKMIDNNALSLSATCPLRPEHGDASRKENNKKKQKLGM